MGWGFSFHPIKGPFLKVAQTYKLEWFNHTEFITFTVGQHAKIRVIVVKTTVLLENTSLPINTFGYFFMEHYHIYIYIYIYISLRTVWSGPTLFANILFLSLQYPNFCEKKWHDWAPMIDSNISVWKCVATDDRHFCLLWLMIRKKHSIVD